MKKTCLLIAFLVTTLIAAAQNKISYSASDYARKPVWIEMIKDTSANFFEVGKAFDTYFAHHEKPGGEHDVIGERNEREKHPSKRMLRKIQADDRMRMEVKKYERWHDKMLPFVQDNGSILTPSQRIQLWKDQAGNK